MKYEVWIMPYGDLFIVYPDWNSTLERAIFVGKIILSAYRYAPKKRIGLERGTSINPRSPGQVGELFSIAFCNWTWLSKAQWLPR